VRWRLRTELADSDYRVRGLVTRVGQPQNLISHHVRLLRDGGWLPPRAAALRAVLVKRVLRRLEGRVGERSR
jgi:hypothetical protein